MTNMQLAIHGGAPAVSGLLDYEPVTEREVAAVVHSLRATPLTTLYGGADVAEFEERFARFFGATHAVCVSSGTSALHAALVALGIGANDEVITPAYSFVASASVIVQQGAIPVFCDIEPDTLNIDVVACRRLITARTKALIAVHIFGKPADLTALRSLCDDAGIYLIEDCAGAAGARVGDRFVGTFGEVGCFSFNIHKVIRTGEGGMAITQSREIAEALRELRVNGLNPNAGVNNVVRLGFNYTMAQPIAALGCEQMRMLPESLTRRAANREHLMMACSDLPVTMLPDRAGTTTIGWWTPLILRKDNGGLRSKVIAALRAEGVPAHGGYGEPLYRIAYLAAYRGNQTFPVCEDLPGRLFTVDPSPWYSVEDMRLISAALRRVLGQLDRL